MTEYQQTVDLLLEKSRRDLDNAASLLAVDGFDNVVVLAYYGALNAARALLLSGGMEPKTHAGALRLLSLHFVRTGRLEPQTANLLALLEAQRTRASYDATAVFTRSMAETALDDARKFHQSVTDLI